MPRGNDAQAAAEELKARTGANPNAEEMIAANAARWPEELRAANNRPVDADATNDLDDDAVQGLVGDLNVLAYAVRGPFVVVVSEDDDGFVVKQTFPREGHEKQAARFMPEDPEEADKRAQKEQEERVKEAEEHRDEAADERAELSRGGAMHSRRTRKASSGEQAPDSGTESSSPQQRQQVRSQAKD